MEKLMVRPGRHLVASIRRALFVAVALAGPLFAQSPSEVLYRDDFQSYGTPANPPGWVDTAIGKPGPVAEGLYKTWPDPTQGNKAPNVVYGTKSASGKPEGRNPRIGTFSTLTTKEFDARGRFEFSGRLIRTRDDGRVGVTFLSQYPTADKYYLFGLWSQPASSKLTMQLFAFDKTLEDPANPLGDQSARLAGTRDSGVTLEANKWYRFFVRTDDRDGKTHIQAKVWLDGSAEPDTFQVDVTDAASQRLTGGHIGLWSAVKGENYIDEILAKSPVDFTAPQISFFYATSSGDAALPNGFQTNQSLTPIIRVTDDIDPNPSFTVTLDDQPFAVGSTVAIEGTHTLRVRATDSVGNVADGQVSFFIDTTSPSVRVLEGTAPLVEGQMFGRDVSVNLEIEDASSTTVTATLNGAPFTPGTPLVPAPLYGVEKHPHELMVEVRDYVGNVTTLASLHFTIDKTAPAVTILKDGGAFSGGAFNTNVVLTTEHADLTPTTVTMSLNGQPYAAGTAITNDGDYTIAATATDALGHVTPAGPIAFVINKTGPAVRFLDGSAPLQAGEIFGRDVPAKIEVINSLVPNVTATLDGASWPLTLESTSGNTRIYAGAIVTTEGLRTLAVHVTDAAGNDVQPSISFTIDKTPPSIAILESGAPFPPGNVFDRDVVATVNVSDAITLAIATMTLDAEPYIAGTTISAEGAYSIAAEAIDEAENRATDGPIDFMIDKSAPVVSLLERDAAFPADFWFNRDVEPMLEISDLTTVTVTATIDGVPVTFTRGPVTGTTSIWSGPLVTTEGAHSITVMVTDVVGHETLLDPVSFTIDKTPPAISVASHSEGQVVTSPGVTLSGASDDAVTITVNGGAATVDLEAKSWSSAELSILEGSTPFRVVGTDKAGNVTEIQRTLNLDTRGPALAVTSPANGACVSASSLTITGTASDGRLASVKARVGATTYDAVLTSGAWTVTIPNVAEGTLGVVIEASDTAGHTTTANVSYRIDRTAPVIEVSEGGAAFGAALVNRSLALFVRATDADPAVQLAATLDGNPYASGSVIESEGAHTLVVSARDCAGLTSTRTIAFRIDKTAPTLANLTPANGATSSVMPGSITGASDDATRVEIVGTAVATTIPAGSPFALANVPFDEGTNRFTLRATDEAGNASELAYVVTVKTTAPSVEILESGGPIAPDALFNRDVTPEIRASESDATITATLNGATYTSGTAITNDGTYTLAATATDALQHSGSHSVTFRIDKTAPAVAITSPAQGASIAMDSVTVTGTSGDATSVTVNGAGATLSAGGFTAVVPVELGENVLVAVGRDEAGNSGRAEVTVARAGEGPAIVLLYPADKSLTNRPKSEVLGRVITPANVQSVTITIVAAHSDAPPFSTIVAPDAAGDFRTTLDLVEGPNTISATALGLDGKSATASVQVTADFTPPVLKIFANGNELKEGERFAEPQSLTLEVSDTQTPSPVVQVTLDGTAVAIPATASNGGHTVVVTARDTAGNEARAERSFTVGSRGVVSSCSITSLVPDPATDAVIASPSVRVAGRTNAEAVRVAGIVTQVVDGAFCTQVQLDREGENLIPIECLVSGEKMGDPYVLKLIRATGLPTVAIDSPADAAVLTTETIVVTGTAGPGVTSVSVNGVLATLSSTDTTTTRTFTASGVRIAHGQNLIAARAATVSGRTATVTRRVIGAIRAGELTITAPLASAPTGAAAIDVSGTWAGVIPESIAASSGAGAGSASFTLLSDTNGVFVVRDVPLTAGANTITVRGRDAANRDVTATLTVTRTLGVPAARIESPADNARVRSDIATITVTGALTAAEGSRVEVNGIGASVSGATFSVSGIELLPAGVPTPIVVRVTQPDGGVGLTSARVVRLAGAFDVKRLETNELLVFPGDGAVQVPASVQILVPFTHEVDRASVAGNVVVEKAGAQPVAGTIVADRDVIAFAPNAPLSEGTSYTIRVRQALADVAGGALAGEVVTRFMTELGAPSAAPTLDAIPSPICDDELTVSGTTAPNARVRVDLGSTPRIVTADAAGRFSATLSLSGPAGAQLVRARTLGANGALSPAAEACVELACATGPSVVAAAYDPGANALAITFSGVVDPATLGVPGSIALTTSDGRAIGGTVALGGLTATVQPSENLAESVFTLLVTTAVKDLEGRPLAAPYTQTFFPGGSTGAPSAGYGYVTGEVYDATNGRPLAGASIRIATIAAATDTHGRYTVFVPEGAHTIEASAPTHTTAWRQIIVPAGAGVVPIDIRLETRGATTSVTTGALTFAHGDAADATTPVTLTSPAGGLTPGSSVTLTSVGQQSLAGLLPLGWSPLASAEVVAEAGGAIVPVTGTLSFAVSAGAVTSAAQSLAAVRYDPARDEWLVESATVGVDAETNVATVAITHGGAYALVYPDKTPLVAPPLPAAGLPLVGVPDRCGVEGACGALTKQAFVLHPPVVMPDQRTTATLTVESVPGTEDAALFPSGTAVQASIGEELRLADGSILTEAPFAADLLLYRTLGGVTGDAVFHLAPSKRATEVFLNVGWEHIRIQPYPGRLDRGTLIGNEGGRVPGDGSVTVDIPAGATPEPVRAEVRPVANPSSLPAVIGFSIISAFDFELSRATQPASADLDGDGQPDAVAPVELLKSANATFALQTVETRQLILAEVLGDTPYGTVIQLASVCSAAGAELRTTTQSREGLPLDGIIHEGRYLLLAATDPIAYATGLVRLGSATGSVAVDARVATLDAQYNALGVADVTRGTGLYSTPVLAAAPVLRPETRTLGQGTPYAHSSAVAADSVLPITLVLTPTPLKVESTTPGPDAVNVPLTTLVQVIFKTNVDPTSITTESITVVNALTGASVPGATVVPKTGDAASQFVTWNLAKDSFGVIIPLKPNARYTVRVAPTVRGTNQALLGTAHTFSFATITQFVGDNQIHPERIRITIPDANGVSRIIGESYEGTTPGALPEGWIAVAVRRGRDFTRPYQDAAKNDQSFLITIGTAPGDAVSTTDIIDLQLVNAAGILAGVIRLTPFVTTDGTGFLAPPDLETRFTTDAEHGSITVVVPAGAFDRLTEIHVEKSTAAAVAAVPNFDQELDFISGVKVDFEGVARKRLQVEIPLPSSANTSRPFYLGYLGQSIRGPRIMITDTMRVSGQTLTTTDASSTARVAPTSVAPNATLTGREVKEYLLGLNRKGVYNCIQFDQVSQPQGFAVIEGLQGGYDLFWDTFASLYIPDFYLVEGRGKVVMPILSNTAFKIEGVDARTGFKLFEKSYLPSPIGEPGTGVTIENPNPDVTGPHPIFADPGRVEVIELVANETRIRNFHLKLTAGELFVTRNPFESADSKLPQGVSVQLLNVRTGDSTDPAIVKEDGSFIISSVPAQIGDRVALIVGVADVSPDAELSVVLSEQIQLPDDDAAFDAALRGLVQLRQILDFGFNDLTPQLQYLVDSGGRRIRLGLASDSLVRGGRYELVLKKEIKDLTGNRLGQGVTANSLGEPMPTGGDRDLTLRFTVRSPQGVLGAFDLLPDASHPSASLRDMVQRDNMLFVSALDGGLLAYDVSNPGGLRGEGANQPKPIAFVPAQWSDGAGGYLTHGYEHHWAVAADHHGRVYATGFTNMFGGIRSYRLEDFLAAETSEMCGQFPAAPARANCKSYGSATVSWRPGYSSSLPISSGTLLSDRAEATPRKLKLVTQDDELEYETLAKFKEANTHSVVSEYPDGYEKLSVTFSYNPVAGTPYYLAQRITVENMTTDMRWSVDVVANGSVTIPAVYARPGHKLKVYRNRHTYGVVSLFGHGIGVFDLNAIESNERTEKPAGYENFREQVIVTRADLASSCYELSSSAISIEDLALSPEAAPVPQPDSWKVTSFAPDVHKGVLGVAVALESAGTSQGTQEIDCVDRSYGLVLRDRASGYVHPRLEAIHTAYDLVGRTANPRFQSVSYYSGVEADYVLLAGGHYGLLAVDVGDPASAHLGEGDLAGCVWVPQGVVSVRSIPGTDLAVAVDGTGRILLVDVSKIDERYDADGNLLPANTFFPTANKALNPVAGAPYGQVGVDDSRIVWASEPNAVTGTLAPIFDPSTGMIYSGETMGKAMRAVSAIDPNVRVLMDLGGGQVAPTGGIVPLGIEPGSPLKDQMSGENASAAAFRVEVTLPGGVSDQLEKDGRRLRLAIQSETFPNIIAPQTPVSYPKSNLRTTLPSGLAERAERRTELVLERDIPVGNTSVESAEIIKALRHQRGFNRYLSPWIVAIADPRASEKYKWTGSPTADDKAAAGCLSCERPARLRGKTEAQGVYEIWSGGRFLRISADGLTGGGTVFTGTPYEYLGELGRLEARLSTIRGRKVRPTEVLVAAHNPPVADGMLQETHYLHSGEVETASADLDAGGRAGVNVTISRTYRSRTLGGTPLGEGWDSPIYRFLLAMPNGDVEFHDGAGEIWTFKVVDGVYESPKGLFLRLMRSERGWSMFDQQWRIANFDEWGRLTSESDEFYDPGKPGSGNVIRYVYDESGSLTGILDPLGRETKLTYWSEEAAAADCTYPGILKTTNQPCGYPGRLQKVESEWRKRSAIYQYDLYGRLAAVNLPEFRNAGGVPDSFSFVGDNRPTLEYSWRDLTPPVPDEPLQSQRYSDFMEFSGNLEGIRDPEQVRLGPAGKKRVTLDYDQGTNPAMRDRNLTQTWATGETATFTATSNRDVLGQERSYTLSTAASFDGRKHILSKRALNVPVIELANSGLPEVIAATEGPTTRAFLETAYDYNEHGEEASVTLPSGLVTINEWLPAPNNAPGTILKSSKENAPSGEFIETQYVFDTAENASASVSGVGRRDGPGKPFSFRDNQSPSRNRQTVSSAQEGAKSSAGYSRNGQLSDVSTSSGGGASMQTKIDYWEPSETNPIQAGRPKRIQRGGGMTSEYFTYSMNELGEETETLKDEIRGTVTTIQKDVEGRVVLRTLFAPAVVGDGFGSAAIVTEERLGYNAEGKLAYESRNQTGIGLIVNTYRYDALGRQIETTTNGAKVGELLTTLKTKTAYNLTARETTEFDPHTDSEATAPRTISKLDGLGRAISVERRSPDGNAIVRSFVSYDIHGQPVYETDGLRAAAITRNDPFGRPVGTLLSDGTRTETLWNEWDEVLETRAFERRESVGTELKLMGRSISQFTPKGRLRQLLEQVDDSGLTRATRFDWTEGDTLTTRRVGSLPNPTAEFSDTDRVRMIESYRDAAGRVFRELVGEAKGLALLEPSNVFAEELTHYEGGGDLITKRVSREPRSGTSYETKMAHDGLGRVIASVQADAYTTLRSYDEVGNQLMVQAPGLAPAHTEYDARGLVLKEIRPDSTSVRMLYDELGNLRKYFDEEGQLTEYDADGLGRITKVRYPDGTSEETRYENGTGVVLAQRDRAGQWIWFEYDSFGGRIAAEHLGGTGPDPDLSPNPWVRYSYDLAGRVVKVANADSAVVYEDFDLLGRPHVSRFVRYAKAPCTSSPSGFCGSGFTTGAVAEVYTQGHEWSVFDERARWRMPRAGSELPAVEPESPWRGWIEEEFDGAGNVVRQQETFGRKAPTMGDLVTTAVARGVGRVANRTRRTANPDAGLTTQFGYADGPGASGPAVVPVYPAAPGAATGLIGRMETLRSGVRLAGTEILRDEALRIGSAEDLGLGSRDSDWKYDNRGRVKESVLLRREGIAVSEPRIAYGLTPSDFYEGRTVAPRLGPAAAAGLGELAKAIEPLTWLATAKPAYEIDAMSLSRGGDAAGTKDFDFVGGRRTMSGDWTLTWDAAGRLEMVESTPLGRRIVYDYDPNDRMIGRTALQRNSDGSWSLETRAGVLARDALPAETTFVWDVVADRLVSVFDSAVARSGATAANPEAALLRQYLHGDQDYDDPVEVLIAAAAGAAAQRYLPIIDQAGAGSLQAIADGDGNLVERVLYADAYGDQPRYLQGAVVERVALSRTPSNRKITIHFTEELVADSIAEGVRLAALDGTGNVLRTSAVVPTADSATALTWSLSDAEWTTLTEGANSIQIAVGSGLRFAAWGDRPLQPPAPWQSTLGQAFSTSEWPLIKPVSISEAETQFNSSAASSSAGATIYEVADLYVVGRSESVTKLLFDFHALPMRDPATGLVYARARWYDPATGSFLSPDPMGYTDSSNLYSFAGGDPVNRRDPLGLMSGSDDEGGAEETPSAWKRIRQAASIGAGAVPILGEVLDAAQVATGYDIIAGERLSAEDRAIAAAALLIPGASASVMRYGAKGLRAGAKALRHGDEVVQAVQAVTRHADDIGKAAVRNSDEATGLLKKGTKGAARREAQQEASERAARNMEPQSARVPEKPVKCEIQWNCFATGTLVATEEGAQPIETIEAGDEVWAVEAAGAEPALGRVAALFSREVSEVWILETANERLVTTDEHPLWVDGKGWTEASEVKAGDELKTKADTLERVTAVRSEQRKTKVLNFEVAGYHNYFVSNAELLVHNCIKKQQVNYGKTYEDYINREFYGGGPPKKKNFPIGIRRRFPDNYTYEGTDFVGVESKYFRRKAGTNDVYVPRRSKAKTTMAYRNDLAKRLKDVRSQAKHDRQLLGNPFSRYDWNLNASYPKLEKWLKSQDLQVHVRPLPR
ncbi:MAG: Ig-like domain-containing protein [Thermoanaerobaculia bacterium]